MTTLVEGRAPFTTGRTTRFSALRGALSLRRAVYGLVLVILLAQVALPIAILLFTSFKDARPTDADFFSLSFTLENFRDAFSSGRLLSVTWTTVQFAVGSTLVALVLGTFLAWIVARTNVPLRNLVGVLTIVQMAVPGILVPIAWTFLASPNIGAINVAWRNITGTEGTLFNVYSMQGLILVNGLTMVPMVYLFVVTVFSSMNSSLEEAAEVSGSSKLRAVRDISLPLAAPGIAAVAIMALMRAWEAFEIPWFLGVNERIFTYASEIYLRTSTPPSNVGLVSTYAVFMLVGAVLMIWWYDRFNQAGERYAVISGKNFSSVRMDLGRWRVPVAILAFAVLTVVILLPLLMLLWMSLNPFFRQFSWEAVTSLSVESYVSAVQAPNILQGFANSLLVGVLASVGVLTLSTLAAWYSARRVAGGRLLYLLTAVPMALPNVIVGVSFLWIFLILPLPIYSTHTALVIAYITLIIAVVSRLVSARMLQISSELEEAAQVAGASFLRAIWTIVVPLLSPALLAGALITMVMSFRELQTTLYLAGPQTRTAAVVMFDMAGDGQFSTVAAFGIVTFAVLLVGLVGYNRLNARMGLEGGL
ncbi:ABC transporter permease [Micromonospora sp. NBC_01813]|uniref:ABC transporter permease n=1 Tax=Micromonospora sp. NBC_01813 TaxID=2975988 RepID=UPI002DD8ED32|nr:iron ABC transporter permease [Micromonospora sp. NBC_01813]WSA08984.1 iron ABC transporter permease [Micromonospora sp. NBC_01813]